MEAETIFDIVPLSEWREVYRTATTSAVRYNAERHLCEHIIARQEKRIAELEQQVAKIKFELSARTRRFGG